MSRPKCDLGHELDFIGENHVEPDEYAEHFPPGDPQVAAIIARRKAYIADFHEQRKEPRPPSA